MSSSDPRPAPEREHEILSLLQARETRRAIDRAKQLFRDTAAPSAEDLLVRAYLLRAAELAGRGLTAEAKVLEDLARERHRAALRRVTAAPLDPGTPVDGTVAALVAAAPGSDAARQAEDELRRALVDPRWLLRIRALPETHPLRAQAVELVDGLERAARGERLDSGLDSIARRSPLAPWKSFAKALEAYHRKDDEGCRQWLAAVHVDSPARMCGELLEQALSGRLAEAVVTPARRRLFDRLGRDESRLAAALEAVDEAFRTGPTAVISARLKTAREVCAAERPDLLDRFRQLASARAATSTVDLERVRDAIGGPARRDSFFWRQFARSTERRTDPLMTAAIWERFAVHAVAEGLFPADGLTMAALYREVARVLDHFDLIHLDEFRDAFLETFDNFESYYAGQPPDVAQYAPSRKGGVDEGFFYPLELLRRAARLDPTPEVFEHWMRRVRSSEEVARSAIEEVAGRWREAFPDDAHPLIELMKLAEDREAMDSAFDYLALALARDPMHPELKRARPRLALWRLIEDVRTRRKKRYERDLADLAGIVLGGDIAADALVPLGRYAIAVADADEGARQAAAAETAATLGISGARLVLDAVCVAAGLRPAPAPRGRPPAREPGTLLAEVARAAFLSERVELHMPIAATQAKSLVRELEHAAAARVPAEYLRALTDYAWELELSSLTHALTVAGLSRDLPEAVPFLAYRAFVLAEFDPERAEEVGRAARALAVRERDGDLIALARAAHDEAIGAYVDALGMPGAPPADLDAAAAQAVLGRERLDANLPRARAPRRRRSGRERFRLPAVEMDAIPPLATALGPDAEKELVSLLVSRGGLPIPNGRDPAVIRRVLRDDPQRAFELMRKPLGPAVDELLAMLEEESDIDPSPRGSTRGPRGRKG